QRPRGVHAAHLAHGGGRGRETRGHGGLRAQARPRLHGGFKPTTGAERRDVLVCHGNVIRYLVTKALGVDTKAWLEMSVGHASLTTIRVEADGSFKLIAIGDRGHIPPNLQT